MIALKISCNLGFRSSDYQNTSDWIHSDWLYVSSKLIGIIIIILFNFTAVNLVSVTVSLIKNSRSVNCNYIFRKFPTRMSPGTSLQLKQKV